MARWEDERNNLFNQKMSGSLGSPGSRMPEMAKMHPKLRLKLIHCLSQSLHVTRLGHVVVEFEAFEKLDPAMKCIPRDACILYHPVASSMWRGSRRVRKETSPQKQHKQLSLCKSIAAGTLRLSLKLPRLIGVNDTFVEVLFHCSI